MKLLPLYSPDTFELVAGWLQQPENFQWLDFGNGRQRVTATLLKVMSQRESHFLRLYTARGGNVPIGVVGLNNVDRVARTGTLWGAAGDKSFRNRGFGGFAASKLVGLAFRELGLHSVNTWVVEGNPSLRIVQRIGFRLVGRQRQCHNIDGRLHDRLLFDVLASEYHDIDFAAWRSYARPPPQGASSPAG